MADLIVRRRLPYGGLIVVDHRDSQDHLHFTIRRRGAENEGTGAPREVPIVWEEQAPPVAH